MISAAYKELNAELHKADDSYGASGFKFVSQVAQVAKAFGISEILDYGCGKGLLSANMPGGLVVTNYDPCIEKYARPPSPHPMVTCTDVMEHIEPEHLDAVLDDLQRLTQRILYCTIATRPAIKTLPDGRNTHLIVQPLQWWLPKLWDRFRLSQVVNMGDKELVVICEVPQ